VVISKAEDNLQKAAYELDEIITENSKYACTEKKLMASEGRDPVTSKTVTDNKIIEQTNCFILRKFDTF